MRFIDLDRTFFMFGIFKKSKRMSYDEAIVVAANRMFVDYEVPNGPVNGANTVFTLAHDPLPGSVHLFSEGDVLSPSIDGFTVVDRHIYMSYPPMTGERLRASYRRNPFKGT